MDAICFLAVHGEYVSNTPELNLECPIIFSLKRMGHMERFYRLGLGWGCIKVVGGVRAYQADDA